MRGLFFMITVIIYGLDQFVVGRLSREMTPNLSKLYELSEDEILFIAPNDMIFHKGVEQTSWNILIHVCAPKKVAVLQEHMAELMLHGIGDVAIHVSVEFYYYSQDDRYQKINESYPRFLSQDNLVDVDDEYPEDIEEGEGGDQIYTGDIFADLNK